MEKEIKSKLSGNPATRKRKEMFLEAMAESMNVVTTASKKTGIWRTTHYDWLENDSGYKKRVEDLENIPLDYAESHLFKRMKEGSDASIIFYLKTKGKKRGYIERTEVLQEVVENLDQKTEEQLLEELESLNKRIIP